MIRLFVFLVAVLPSYLNAQDIFGPQQVLINNLIGVQNITNGDITGNGYQDLLTTGFFETRVVLFENGPNGFETTTVLEEGDLPRAVVAIDINDDGNLDVAYSDNNTKDLKFILNNGDGTFTDPTTIATLILNIFDLKTVDLDGDDDDDILLASSGVLPRWYENDNGSFNEHIISGTVGRSLELGDIDQDGDIDIVSSASGSITCVWYENDGNGMFSAPQTIRGAGLATSSVFVNDLNGDTLLDVMIAVPGDESIAWFENLGGGSFGPEQNITTTLVFATRVIAADLDNDTDIDVIAAGGDQLVWFENMDGLGTFGDTVIISEEIEVCFSIVAVDLDNDGDLDIANTSRNNHTVAWHENTTILGVDGPKVIDFKVYPNPSSEYFIIQATQTGVEGYTLYDIHGKQLQKYAANTHTIDARTLATGVYVLALKTTRGDTLYQKLVKK